MFLKVYFSAMEGMKIFYVTYFVVQRYVLMEFSVIICVPLDDAEWLYYIHYTELSG